MGMNRSDGLADGDRACNSGCSLPLFAPWVHY